MSATRTYDWSPNPRANYRARRDWSLRWWVMLAIILSFVFHGMLYVSFNVMPGLAAIFEPSTPARPLQERVQIDPALLQDQRAIQEIPETLTPPPGQPDIKAFEPKLDDFDKAQMIPENQEIDLTPNVKEITNFIRADEPGDSTPAAAKAEAMAQALAPEALAAPDLAKEMASVRKEVLTKPISEKQLLINSGGLEPKEGDIDMDLVSEVTRQNANSTNASGVRVRGFSNLDDLLGHGGKVGGDAGPILMPTDLLFEYGSDQLAEGARLSLMKLGFLIQKNPESLFIIEGHTDSYGTDAFNRDLSQRRALAVVNWLMTSLRLTPDRIQAVGMGESHFIVDPNGSVEQQALNRRVEIKVRPRRK